jgi:hypothetical protein
MKDFPAVHVKPDANVMRFLAVYAHQDAATVLRTVRGFGVTSLDCLMDCADNLDAVAGVNRVVGKNDPEVLTVNVNQ